MIGSAETPPGYGAEPKKIGRNINDWAAALEEVDEASASKIDEPRSVGFEGVERLNLPRYKRREVPLGEFLASPDETFAEIGSEKFYVTLLPKRNDLRRVRKSGLSKEDVLGFVHSEISNNEIDDYSLIIQEYFDNLYGGNIVVNPSGQIYIEFKTGKQGEIADGTATPEFTAKRDRFLKAFEYSFEDTHLREIIYKTILSIPHSGEAREMEFPVGYYEFVIVQKNEDLPVEPIFIDYRENPAYLIPDK